MRTDNLSHSDDSGPAPSSSLGWMKALKQAADVNLPPTPVAIQTPIGTQHGVTQIVMVPHGMTAQQGVPMYVTNAHSQPVVARRPTGNTMGPHGRVVATHGHTAHRRSASSSGFSPAWVPNQPDASPDTGAAPMSEMACTGASVITSGAVQGADGMYVMAGRPPVYHMQRKEVSSMSDVVLAGTAAGTARHAKPAAFHNVEGQDELRGEEDVMFSFGEVAGSVQAPKRQRRRHTTSGVNLSFGDVSMMADDEMDGGAFTGRDLPSPPQICGEPMSWLMGGEMVGQSEIGSINDINELMAVVAEPHAEAKHRGEVADGEKPAEHSSSSVTIPDAGSVPVLEVIEGQVSFDEEHMKMLMSDEEAKGMFADLLADLGRQDSAKILSSPPSSPSATTSSIPPPAAEQQQQKEDASAVSAPAAGVAAGVAVAAKMAAASVSATVASVQVVSRGTDADSLMLRCDSVSSSKVSKPACGPASPDKASANVGATDLPVVMGTSANAIWKEAHLALEKSLQTDSEAVTAPPSAPPAPAVASSLLPSKSCEPLRPSALHSASPSLMLSRSFNATSSTISSNGNSLAAKSSPAASPLLVSAGPRRPLVVTSNSSGSSGSSVTGQKRLLELPVMKPLSLSTSGANPPKKEQAASRPSRMPLLRMPDLNALPSRPASSGAPAVKTPLKCPVRSPTFSSPLVSHGKPRSTSPMLTCPSMGSTQPAAAAGASARPLGFPAKVDRRVQSFGNASELSGALKAPLGTPVLCSSMNGRQAPTLAAAATATPADAATAGILEGLVGILAPSGQNSSDLVAALVKAIKAEGGR